nr:hypothetical protein [Moorena producens]
MANLIRRTRPASPTENGKRTFASCLLPLALARKAITHSAQDMWGRGINYPAPYIPIDESLTG